MVLKVTYKYEEISVKKGERSTLFQIKYKKSHLKKEKRKKMRNYILPPKLFTHLYFHLQYLKCDI